MNKNLDIDKKRFDEDGYFIVKNVFSPEEVRRIRDDVYKQYEIDKKKNLTYQLPQFRIEAKFANGDLLSKELLHPVLLNENILKIARTILGNDDLVYFGDSSYQIGTGSNGFHRDNIDRSNLNGPDWKGEYTLVRLGLYLQDHKRYSGGLKVRKGSHKNPSGPAVFVDSEVGDMVIWDLKTYHSGNAVRLKSFPDFSINIAMLERNIPHSLRKEEEQERISLFMTFALRSSHLDRYINEYTLKRKDTIEHAKASVYSESALEMAKQKNVEVMRPVK
jgi:hypothetical protein